MFIYTQRYLHYLALTFLSFVLFCSSGRLWTKSGGGIGHYIDIVIDTDIRVHTHVRLYIYTLH